MFLQVRNFMLRSETLVVAMLNRSCHFLDSGRLHNPGNKALFISLSNWISSCYFDGHKCLYQPLVAGRILQKRKEKEQRC